MGNRSNRQRRKILKGVGYAVVGVTAVILLALRDERAGRTVVLVSHRASTMRIADTVYSVENGRMS